MTRQFLRLALIVSFFYLLVLQLRAIWPFTIDDMYISLQYAKHWAAGYGLVWNVGEPPVEGYSNFSFVFFARLALMLGFDPVVMLKSIGVISLCLVSLAIYYISRYWFLRRLAIIPCLWLLAYKGQILWTVSGLETTLYQALIGFSVFFILKGLGYAPFPQEKKHTHVPSLAFAGLLLAVASMTRPEAPALMALFVVLIWLNRPQPSTKQYWQGLLFFCAFFILCFAPYFFWRWNYYGYLFPNSVYCKGLNNVLNFKLDLNYLKLVWPFMLLALPACWYAKEAAKDRRHLFLWLPSVIYCLLLIGADPIVAFDNRLFLPAFVLLLPLTLQGIFVLLRQLLRRQDEVLEFGMFVVAGLLLFFCIPMMSLPAYHHFTENPLRGERLRQKIVTWLDKHTTEQSRVVLADSGLIPFRSTRKFTDSYCLNNLAMRTMSRATMYSLLCNQVLVSKPDVIILTSLIEDGKPLYTPTDACLASHLVNSHNYQLQRCLGTGNSHSYYQYEIYQLNVSQPHF